MKKLKYYTAPLLMGALTAFLITCSDNGPKKQKTSGISSEKFRELEQSAEAGNAVAQNYLGSYYLEEYYASRMQDIKSVLQAEEWYLKSSNQNNQNASCNLGMIYKNIEKLKDYNAALTYLKNSASADNYTAQFELSTLLIEYAEQGSPLYYIEAFKWRLQAAQSGDPFIEKYLALMYFDGQGTPKNYSEAAKWFQASAVQGDMGAQYFLADLLFTYGTRSQSIQAYAWANLSGTKSSDSISLRDHIAKNLSSAELSEAQTLSSSYIDKYGPHLKEIVPPPSCDDYYELIGK